VPAVDLADPLGHVIEEVAIVRDGEHGALVVLEEMLEPEHGLGVQMVRGLVEEQQIGRLEQELAESHATALTAGEHLHRHVGIGQLEGVHRLAELGIDIPAIGRIDLVLELAHLGHEGVEVRIGLGHLLADLVEAVHLGEQVAEGHAHILDDGLIVVERRLLLQEPHRVAGREAGIAVGNLLLACHDLEQGRLAHAVGAHDTDLGAGVKRQGHVVENDLVAMRFARLVHLVDELCHIKTPCYP